MLRSTILTGTLAVALAAPSLAQATPYTIDTAHSEVGFKIKHLMVSNVWGRFTKFEGKLELDEKDITKSSIAVTIDMTSIDTGNEKRDNHLRSGDFFNVEKFPTMTFKSTRVRKLASGLLKVDGELTLHGVTKPVLLVVEGPTDAVKGPYGNVKRGVSASTTISRKDFGLTWNKVTEAGGVVVGDKVKITLEVELNEAKS